MSEEEKLAKLVGTILLADADLHRIYGSTSTCGGGIGGQAMTPHCGVVCQLPHKHIKENNQMESARRAYMHYRDGNPDWFDYLETT